MNVFGKLRLDLKGSKAIDIILGLLYVAIAYQINQLRQIQTVEGIFYLALLLFSYYTFITFRGIYNNNQNRKNKYGNNSRES